MNNRRTPNILRRLLEPLATVGLVLLFFMAFLGMLQVLFPEGSTLQDLMSRQGAGSRQVESIPRAKTVTGSGLFEEEGLSATLARVRNQVKSKPADAIAWRPAARGATLKQRDAVQTLGRSSTRILFDDGSALDLGEKSLIILRELSRDRVQRKNLSRLVLMDGQLRGSASPGATEPLSIEVEMPNAVATIFQPEAVAAAESFLVTVNPDKSSTIAVYHGHAEVTAQGQTVEIKEQQSTTVAPDQPPAQVVELPRPPAALSPVADEVLSYRNLPPRVRFTWEPSPGSSSYRFRLARDPGMQDLVVDETILETVFTHGGLKPGSYYWSVCGINGWAAGHPNPARTLTLLQDREPPPLEVDFPPETLDRPEAKIAGRTEPGAQVYIDGAGIALSSSGEFELPLRLASGINVITIEAIDEVGNIAYRSQKVFGKF